MRAVDQARSLFDRVRANPGVSVAVVAGGLLTIAWIGWAIYVTSENGSRAGLGVLVAVPALAAAIGLVVLVFFGGYRLLRWLSGNSESEEQPSGEPESAGEAEKTA